MATVCRAYIRVSTEEQAEEGYSLEAQTQSIRSFAQDKGWMLADSYSDEGISAKDMKRPQLQRLLKDLQVGEVLIVWKLDRLSRSVMDSETIFKRLDKNGCQFLSIMEPHLSTAGPGGTMVRQMTSVFAEFYRGQLGENVRHGMTQMVKQGKWSGGRVPLGYECVDKRLVPNAQADLVRRMFALYVEGLGVRTIVKRLNDQGIRTPRGSAWAAHSVSHILQNPIYAGKVRYGHRLPNGRLSNGSEILADGEHKAIIDPGLWEQARAVMTRRKTTPARQATGDYPLTGVARCGLCGSAVSGSRRIHGRTTRVWRREYRCVGRTHKAICNLHGMMADKVEEAFIRTVERWTSPEWSREELAKYAPTTDEREQADEIKKRLLEIDRRIARWDAVYEIGDMAMEEYTEKTKPLRKDRKDLSDEYARLTTPGPATPLSALIELGRTIRGKWEVATAVQRKELVHSLCAQVILRPGYQVELILR